ncbi:MAG: monovalent cation/H+ antiporter subunit D family protein [Rhodobiaceae bacterium]|jgi:multicomponent Na+:H+ antiporter subunit D|nr:monovalent cation/H+ antiporter subunit D family protein [Rhodobiaceae bacterium]
MMQHLPVLQVLLPLLAAPFAALLRGRDLAWGVAFITTGAAFLISIALFLEQRALGTTLVYEMGNWAAPIGIVYVIDAASALVLPVISGIGFVATLAARQLVAAEIDARDHALFYAAWLLTIAGMLGQVTTGDAFNIFVFLEISSLSAYALVAMGSGRDRRALPAAFNYLILGTVGATFYVIGLGLLYMLTGTLNLVDLAERLPQVEETRAAFTAMAFIALGLFLKMALFPLHFWLVPAYAHAPSAVTALMASTATKVSVYVLIRLIFGVFGVEFPGLADAVGLLVLTLGIAGAFVGTLAAIVETDLKKLFAQSSIAQLGYMAIGIGAMSATGLAAAFLHLFNHALMKGALFLAIGMIAAQAGRATMGTIQGAGKQIPITMTAILFGGLALIGVPLTAGFISKLYLIRALLEQDFWLLAGLTFLSSALALAYVWKIIEAAWLQPRPKGAPKLHETASQYIPAWIMVIATLGFGIYATPLVQAAFAAAHVFIPSVAGAN